MWTACSRRVEDGPGHRPAATPTCWQDVLSDTRSRIAADGNARIEARFRPKTRSPDASPRCPVSTMLTAMRTGCQHSRGRQFPDWAGLRRLARSVTPKPHSSGGKERLGGISKAGNRYLRRLLYLGAMAQISARRGRKSGTDWLSRMLERKPVKVVAIALANRMARVVWALIRTGESYRAMPA